MTFRYVHGYDDNAKTRLDNQAQTLAELLHSDILFKPGDRVLEVGCGVGAQTRQLVKNNPETQFYSIDRDEASIETAKRWAIDNDISTVHFFCADLTELTFAKSSFDHLFVCFVLEHLPEPDQALSSLAQFIKIGGSVTVIEGDHGSVCAHPGGDLADAAIACQVELQRRAGGDPMIGRKLFPLLSAAGYSDVNVFPKIVYADSSKPVLVEQFTEGTFISMIDGVRQAAIEAELTTAIDFDRGIQQLRLSKTDRGTFSYTFYKARGNATQLGVHA